MRTFLPLLLSFTLTSTSLAQPANDLCTGAQLLSPGVPVSSTTTGATASAPGSCNNATISPDVWYQLNITTAAWYTVDATSTANFNARLYLGCPGASPIQIFCEDRPPNSPLSATHLLSPGSYLLRISGFFGQNAPFTVSYNIYTTLPYDQCANAVLISPTSTGAQGNNLNCTNSTLPDPPCSAPLAFHSDVWWRWDATAAGTLLLGSFNSQPAATSIAVYDGGTAPACPIDQSTFLICNTPGPVLGVNVLPGHAYYIRNGSPFPGVANQGISGFSILFTISTSGACCATSGVCTLTTSSPCTSAGNTYRGNGTVCSPNPCPAMGACCGTLNSCNLRTRSDCQILARIYLGDGTSCTATPCSQIGTCCRGTICNTNVSRLDCAGIGTGGQFVLTSSCTTPQQTPVCCAPDYNHTGGTNVQDIFDFLAAWFSSNPWTNINGGPLDVADIFSFLSAWFTGC